MTTITKMALAVLAGLLIGGGALAVADQGADDGLESTTTNETTTTEQPGDVSGPCDEAEHANDPRCTGEGGGRVDNSGPGSANSGHGHGDDDGDREDNSGPGSANSGHGNSHDDDDGDDDNSGHGSSGSGHDGSDDDDDNSGSGHGGSDDD